MTFRRLQLRFLLVVVASAVVFASVAGGLAFRTVYRQAIEAGSRTLGDLLSAVEKTAAIGAYTGDKVLLQEVIDGLARHGLAARVSVHTPQGLRLDSARRGASAAADDGQVSVQRTLLLPFEPREAVGELRIEADMDALRGVARRQALALALAMAGQIALVSLVLYLAAARLVSQPIVRLASALRRMRPGTAQRLRVPAGHADDEIGVLIGGANALLQASEDTLERERALRAEVEAMEAQYRQIFNASSAGIFVFDDAGRLINCNRTVFELIGASAAELAPMRGEQFLQRAFAHPDEVQAMVAASARRRETVSADLQLLRRDGEARWVHCLISVQTPTPQQRPLVEGVMYDVTERKRTEQAVRHQADHDALTGLKNRLAGEAAVEQLLAEARQTGHAMALLCIDLDGFKQVNDRLGHDAGDQVLRHCARALQAMARRGSDVACRVGGDEFFVVLDRCDADDERLVQVAGGLVQALCQPITLDDGRSARIGASVGIACYPRHGRSYQRLTQLADAALYAVKHSGKNSFAMAMKDD